MTAIQIQTAQPISIHELASRKPADVARDLSPQQLQTVGAHVVASLARAHGASLAPQLQGPAEPALAPAPELARQVQQLIQRTSSAEDSARTGRESLRASAQRHLGGADADGQNGAAKTGGGLMVADKRFAVFVALQQVMMEFKEMAAKDSVAAVYRAFEVKQLAGEAGITAAEDRFHSQIGGAVVQTAIGGAALSRTIKSTNMTTNSLHYNVRVANKSNITLHTGKSTSAAAATPSAQLKAEGSLSASAQASPAAARLGDTALTANPNPAAPRSVQSDLDGDTPAMRAVAESQPLKAEVTAGQDAHGKVSAMAQVPFAQASLLVMVASAVHGVVTSAGDLAAASHEAERMMLEQSAETNNKIATGQQEEARLYRQQRDAALQTLVQLNSNSASTGSHIIGGMRV